MRLQELKQQVYQAWECLSTFNLAVVQPENFLSEVRQQFGDLRRKETWVKALARFTARNCYDACLDAYSLILYDFNFTRDRWDYEYRYLIIEEFLTIPGALELIQLGLEQLFSSTFTPHEREQANGFFELVPAAAVRVGLSVGFIRQLEGTSQARASRHSDGLQRLSAVYD
jgi:hypothetical protein